MARPRAAIRSATEIKLHQIARLQLLDWPIERIAEHLSLAAETVSEMIGFPRYRAIRDSLIKDAFETVDGIIQTRKANVMLEDGAADAAEALFDLLELARPKRDEEGKLTAAGCDPETARLTSFGILDRAGYGPVQRKQQTRRLELDPLLAALMRQALTESVPARIVELPPSEAVPAEPTKP